MEYEFPDDLKYMKTHEWVRIEGDMATIGITDYAQHQLGDIVYVELPEIGRTLEKESSAGEIESVKAVGEILMPLSGEIVEINAIIIESPESINSSPYGAGWMMKIKVSNSSEINELLSVEDYKKIIEEEKK
ncbi:MAG: glycine cleavage system protein H [Promethearchaeota archaeon Loki_b31]|nr:MAG: glycine cleavage system protein H [Candidatus Lokiarchaeota archaeon Loki_b31]